MNRETLKKKQDGMAYAVFFWFVPAMGICPLFLSDIFGYGNHWYGLWVFTAVYACLGVFLINRWFAFKTMKPDYEQLTAPVIAK